MTFRSNVRSLALEDVQLQAEESQCLSSVHARSTEDERVVVVVRSPANNNDDASILATAGRGHGQCAGQRAHARQTIVQTIARQINAIQQEHDCRDER